MCLNESMSIWFSRWTCPGWVFCPQKPHDKGNEYHSACCGLTGVMFSIELVEGKDRSPDLGPSEFELRMLKDYCNIDRYVVLDSRFCGG
jgi:hypothetical protein